VRAEKGEQEFVILGRVSGLYGVRGWLKIYAYSRPRENIFAYDNWLLQRASGEWQARKVESWRFHGRGLVALLEGIYDRTTASGHVGQDIAVNRKDLPALEKGEYYWRDLMGLEVVNMDQRVLGRITGIQETGANDVLVVEGGQNYLIPLLKGSVVRQVDREKGRMLVDWDGEYI